MGTNCPCQNPAESAKTRVGGGEQAVFAPSSPSPAILPKSNFKLLPGLQWKSQCTMPLSPHLLVLFWLAPGPSLEGTAVAFHCHNLSPCRISTTQETWTLGYAGRSQRIKPHISTVCRKIPTKNLTLGSPEKPLTGSCRSLVHFGFSPVKMWTLAERNFSSCSFTCSAILDWCRTFLPNFLLSDLSSQNYVCAWMRKPHKFTFPFFKMKKPLSSITTTAAAWGVGAPCSPLVTQSSNKP